MVTRRSPAVESSSGPVLARAPARTAERGRPPARRSAVGFVLPLAAVAACAVEPPTQPTANTRPPNVAVSTDQVGTSVAVPAGGAPGDAMSIADLLSDPLFRASLSGVTASSLAVPLGDAVDALESDQTARAGVLFARAAAAAESLEDDPGAVESLILWAVIERYLEQAELL